jgi:glyoxalase family protein
MAETSPIRGYHHVTLCVGSAREDYDFHVKLLGLRMIKKTVLLDGAEPFYHLYYGNEIGEEDSLVTTFPMSWRTGGVRGSGQVRVITLDVPDGSLSFWRKRLESFGYRTTKVGRLGAKRVGFSHPCGVEYEFAEADQEIQSAWTSGGVPAEAAIRGIRSVAVSTRDLSQFDAFLVAGLGFQAEGKDGRDVRFTLGAGKKTSVLEVLHEPDRARGSWTYAAGTVHHIAFNLADDTAHRALKGHLEGVGYVDVSEIKDRNYFNSIYVRTPAGALIEAAVTCPRGWLKDETWETLGRELKLPAWLETRRKEMVGKLEPLAE